ESYTVSSPYLATPDEQDLIHYSDYGPQLSRGFRALKIWWAIRAFGVDAFREAVERQLSLADYMSREIAKRSAFELAAPVTFTAVCFRILGLGDPQMTNVLAQ